MVLWLVVIHALCADGEKDKTYKKPLSKALHALMLMPPLGFLTINDWYPSTG